MRKALPELELEIVDRLPGFSCSRCSRCCTGKLVAIYDRDVKRLEAVTRDFCVRTTKQECRLTGAGHKMVMKNGRCTLLDENGLCRFYDSRPDTCRRHPFMAGKYLLVASTCRGVDWSQSQDADPYRELSRDISKKIDSVVEKMGH